MFRDRRFASSGFRNVVLMNVPCALYIIHSLLAAQEALCVQWIGTVLFKGCCVEELGTSWVRHWPLQHPLPPIAGRVEHLRNPHRRNTNTISSTTVNTLQIDAIGLSWAGDDSNVHVSSDHVMIRIDRADTQAVGPS